MIKSMTGFGKAVCELKNKKITVEIKSLNSKSLNLLIKIPEFLKDKEAELRSSISSKLERGKVEFLINSESTSGDLPVSINKEIISSYYETLREIVNEKSHSLHDEQIFQVIMRLPEVLQTKNEILSENEWAEIKKTVDNALKDFDSFRKQEGKSLKIDILQKIENIENLLEKVPEFEQERIEKLKNRLKVKLSEIKENTAFDQNRYEQEIIYYLEKFDINEEKVRLKNHCKFFKETAESPVSSGRKLNFISQEIGREINTLGSKANHSEIQRIVVNM